MKTWTRRQFGRGAGAAGLTVLCPHIGRSQARARVVVIGGGIGGVSVAKYLAQATPAIDVTLVSPTSIIPPVSSAISISPDIARSKIARPWL